MAFVAVGPGARGPRTKHERIRVCRMTAEPAIPNVSLGDERPAWAGGGPVTKLVNALIGFEPLYEVIRTQAKRLVVQTAEEGGIPWVRMREELEHSGARDLFDQVRDPSVEYPDYYDAPFHAYPKGNLCWDAAFEAEAATLAISIRAMNQAGRKSGEEALQEVRDLLHNKVAAHAEQNLGTVQSVLDVGCSVGVSTRELRRYLLDRREESAAPLRMVGLDLSPYMLSVASWKSGVEGDGIEWVHGKAEALPFAEGEFDVVSMEYIVHEMPSRATMAAVVEAARVLRPGGTLFLTDNDPKSETIRNLPAPVFTMMKSTEPYSDQYYMLDLTAVLEQAGFEVTYHGPCDVRHRAVVGVKR